MKGLYLLQDFFLQRSHKKDTCWITRSIYDLHGRHQAHETSNRLHETVRLTIYLDDMFKAASNSSSNDLTALWSPAGGEYAQINPLATQTLEFLRFLTCSQHNSRKGLQDARRLLARDSQKLTQFLGKGQSPPLHYRQFWIQQLGRWKGLRDTTWWPKSMTVHLTWVFHPVSTARIYPPLPERPMQIGSTPQKDSAVEATCHISYQDIYSFSGT